MNASKILFAVACLLFRLLSATIDSTDIYEKERLKASREANAANKYLPTWDSLDSRPLPTWYDEAKLGIFMHWGVYSVPSFGSEWFWWYWKGQNQSTFDAFMKKNYRPDFTYADFGPKFTAEFFNATKFAELVKNSGARYLVLTSKHHEGFTMWPSKYSWNWNSLDLGPARDLVGELAQAVRTATPEVKFGLYYSLFEWFHPLYIQDSKAGFRTEEYNRVVMWPQIREIIETYKPEIVWSDGDGGAADAYWKSQDILAWLYNESPVRDTVVTNDRWGNNTNCKHGGFFTCDDRYNPGTLQPHKWENCMTVDSVSWGYRRTMQLSDVLSIQDIIQSLASTISCGGNLLLNVGPTHDGRIVPIFEERLLQLGQWLQVNGEAVYGTKPWIHQNDTVASNIWYTSKVSGQLASVLPAQRLRNPQLSAETTVYAFVLRWPANNKLFLGAPTATAQTSVSMLGYPGKMKFVQAGKNAGITVDFGGVLWQKLPNSWAWVLKLQHLASIDEH